MTHELKDPLSFTLSNFEKMEVLKWEKLQKENLFQHDFGKQSIQDSKLYHISYSNKMCLHYFYLILLVSSGSCDLVKYVSFNLSKFYLSWIFMNKADKSVGFGMTRCLHGNGLRNHGKGKLEIRE